MWTNENRGRYDRSRLRYPSDLTDEEWAHSRRSPSILAGFRRREDAQRTLADIRSVVETARRRSIRAIDAIRLTLQGLPIPSVA